MSASDDKTPTNSRQRTRVKQINLGDNLDQLFDESGTSKYDIYFFDHDKVTDIDAMLAYCKCIGERAEQKSRGMPPMILAYYSQGLDWHNFTETVMRYQHFGIFTCIEKSADALADLDTAVQNEWAKSDAEHEALLRSLHPEVAAQEGQWHGRLTINDARDNTYQFSCELGSFLLRGGNPENYIGKPVHWLLIRGKILAERADAEGIDKLLQVLEVSEISADFVSAEEIAANLKAMSEGPFLGRLNHPEIFGENPDLYAPMTQEQWDKMLNPEKYGCERID
jgi:hypothetical protein